MTKLYSINIYEKTNNKHLYTDCPLSALRTLQKCLKDKITCEVYKKENGGYRISGSCYFTVEGKWELNFKDIKCAEMRNAKISELIN